MQNKVSLFKLFLKFAKIGAFTFGGGYAMIPLIEKEVVSNGWISKEDIVDIVAIAQSIPGAIAVNMSLFVGYRVAKKTGALVAVFGCIIPSIIIILSIATVFKHLQNEPIVQHAFTGILSAVVALILISALKMAKLAIVDVVSFLIALITVVLLFFINYPVLIIIAGVLFGMISYYINALKYAAKVGDKND